MSEKATFAAGCFWGVEHIYNKHFKKDGIQTKVGYTDGSTENPNYKEVCTGSTEHAEALEITFDPNRVSYETLVEFFYKMHDPTTDNYQGPDVGTQYRSAIFYHSPEQKTIAEKVTQEVQEKHYKGKPIVTKIVAAKTFYDAETYHQLYLEKNPEGYECPTHFLRW
ncbi:Peptide-methionine (S)-S-oxide reductase [Apophysomyces sp. BC1034]|nr:Peptide-methionine (S)-S-oxide reductase [Apophysomyces sp. BC1015]KAG0172291.1 Peptide-methionine (S)-S-oxide reductase [Apophysomyces sp. BC1021]KAG0184095.1 Peptide-methionine (S)-S-oxide reductase [Apophysomyces sp. BC1034]